jgi:hypothetical protein
VSKRFNILLLIFFFLFTTITVWGLKLNSTISTIFYLIIPSVYLLLKYPGFRKQILIFSLPFGVILATVLEYFATYNRIWVANSHLPNIFGYLSLESFLWWPGWIIIVIAIYNIFINPRHKKTNENFKWFILLLAISVVMFAIWLLLGSPRIEYAYLKFFSLPIIAPIIYLLIKKPKIFPNIIKFSLIVAIFSLIYEIVGLKLSHWTYPGEYIGIIHLFGINMPIEELLLWVILGSVAIVSYYEITNDDIS